MFYVLCTYLFLYIPTIRADSPALQSNCSIEVKPLLDIITVQGKIARPLTDEDQLPVEHVMPSLDVIPCDLVHFREDIEKDQHHYKIEADKHLKNPELTTDRGCGCSYMHKHWWKPDEWTNFTENKLQQQTQGYEMIMLKWVRVAQEKFVFLHINPEYHYKRHIYGYYYHDLLAFTQYIIASFVEKYQWTA